MEDINVDSVQVVAERARSVTDGPRNFETQHRTVSGEVRDVDIFATPIEVQGRRLVCAIVHDVTERRRAERRQQLMIAELDHRVKNNLSTIMSLADQTGRSTSSFAEFNQAFVGRLRALARMHAVLASNQWTGASLDSIVRQTLAAFAAQDAEYTIQGGDVIVAPREAQSLALILHELATNASKYGAFSAPGGAIDVQWSVREATAEHPLNGVQNPSASRPARDSARFALLVSLSWQERGGPPTESPTRTGFGLDLVRGMLAHELGGHVDFQFKTQGLRCELVFGLQGHAWKSADATGSPDARSVVVNTSRLAIRSNP
jgi:two-component sensor histidine kinase